ncbi:MAG: D-2-hydroxyacid dehydrogenase [Rhodocyclaceae bacterium]|nr:D-2-hydroxyacid dehydrogenase [Rhodocyclaceae bacterium]
MNTRIVFLERDSVPVAFRKPAFAHEWVDFGHTHQSRVVERLVGAQIAVINKRRIGSAELEALPGLRMIALAATGSDNIDLTACATRGVVVSNVRGYALRSVPEHVMALVLALSRRLFEYVGDVRAGRWATAPNFCFLDHPISDLHGKTLVLVGAGALGEGVARLAQGFGMEVVRAERRGVPSPRPGYRPFDDALALADVVSVHCPLTTETRGLFDGRSFSLMKPGALFINTARGGVVDDQSLVNALKAGTIAGAAIDVLTTEPPAADHPLLAGDIPNLLITPHVAWASREAMESMAGQVIENIEAFVGGTPRNRLV